MVASICTPWDTPIPPKTPANNQERHAMFVEHVRQVAATKMPWLFPLLDECEASIFVQPGVFLFSLQSHLSGAHEVPEMARLLSTLPWVEEDAKPQ